MHNPLRSEQDAFKWFVVFLAGAILVGLVGAIVGPTAGIVVAVVLVAGGAAIAYRASQGRMGEDVPLTRGGDGKHRVLVVANETVGGGTLLEEIRSHCGDGKCEVRLVTPVQPSSRTAHLAGDIDEAIVLAGQRMELSVIELQQNGMKAKGEVGEAEPNVALEDALRSFPADEIIISTHPEHRSQWLERGVVERAREEIDLPITHVVVDLEVDSSALSR